MIANGHSWSSIKSYSLSEIGIFFRTIILKERESKIENISHTWMGTHLSHEGLNEILGESGKPKKIQQPSVEEANKDWSRLKSFMSGVQ